MVCYFEFFGLTVEVITDCLHIAEGLRRRFAYFEARESKPQVFVEIRVEAPPYAGLPSLPASFFTSRNVSFQNNKTTYIDYFGQALAIFDRDTRQCRIFGTPEEGLTEIACLLILSTVAEHLDSRGIHGVRGLGVSCRGKG